VPQQRFLAACIDSLTVWREAADKIRAAALRYPQFAAQLTPAERLFLEIRENGGTSPFS
jgi:hypothetical protein